MDKKLVTMDGNEAAAYVAYAFTEVAAIYPITPSSPMAEKTDAWSAKGKTNIFGQPVTLIEMESEAGAAAAVHGALETGALASSFTSSQGLMLMIPVMHRLSGQRHPAVLHVASRTVGTHAFSIFGDHSDVMNCRQTGFAMLSSGSVQEIMDLGGIAHLAAIKCRIPFMHFFDGFRTSHEIDKIEQMDYSVFDELLDKQALADFRALALNPEHPMLRSTVQNPDVYFQVRESNNTFYDKLPGAVEDYMAKISAITGREYHLFNYYGAPDAQEVVIAMGSVSGTIRETLECLAAQGRKVGFLQVHLYRPFAVERFLSALPETVKKITVLDRCKEAGAPGEPLYLDVSSAILHSGKNITVLGGRYGLSSKDTDVAQIKAVFDNMASDNPVNGFSVGINDDVTHLSLPADSSFRHEQPGVVSCKFWGLGSDGTVGANKNTVGIINDHTPLYAQAYFEYDAKKSFGVTKSHLRFGPDPISSTYLVKSADFIACHNETYIRQYDIVSELKEGGTFLLNCTWAPGELEEKLPAQVRRILKNKNINFYIIDATDIALSLGLGTHVNMILQAAFFRLANIIECDEAVGYMKAAVRKTYGAKGEDVVNKNLAAIDEGIARTVKIDIPDSWADAVDAPAPDTSGLPDAVKNLLIPINAQKGDDLPVSAFKGYEDGRIDMGLTAYEKRAISVKVPKWNAEKCLQCNQCAFVCPHAVIRPYLLDKNEKSSAPEGFVTVPAKGAGSGYFYNLSVSGADCTGCGSCVECCPAKEKAITMEHFDPDEADLTGWNYGLSLSDKGDVFDPYTVKGSQFRTPLLEFSAACAGCGETPYAKLLTQLFGDRVYWANATGCTQAWGAPMPGIPYTTNKKGFGPAWSNSLFENNAEFSLGMLLSVRQQREAQKLRAKKLAADCDNDAVTGAVMEWLGSFDDFDGSRKAGDKLCEVLTQCADSLSGEKAELAREILRCRDQLSRKTFWMFGGDGWAYDIGYGGLDHVIATGENINVFIVDTEVYSNTGGQSSKATPIGAVAQFAVSGKKSKKKDLGALMMTYGNVYVAQVAMGADRNQLIKAVKEAESYNGPSVIIAYAPCSAHGIKNGMSKVQLEMKRAVQAGYWHLYRYDPRSTEKPFTLDSAAPSLNFFDFLRGEVRYQSLTGTFLENAAELFTIAQRDAVDKYDRLLKLVK